MSQEDPKSNKPFQDSQLLHPDHKPTFDPSKPTEGLSLSERLERKYGIIDEELKKIKAEKEASKELGSSIKEEVSDTNFIDLEKYSVGRSRHIERKYGLTPLHELISPKTPEQKKKEIEEYMRKSSLSNVAKRQMNKLSNEIDEAVAEQKKEDEQMPELYHYMEGQQGILPDINVGEKWAMKMADQVMRETALSRSARRGGYQLESFKRGRLGIDKYVLMFSAFGAIVLPFYIYYRGKRYKEIVQAERGLDPANPTDLEKAKYDIDDMSQHRRWFVDREERKKNAEKLAVRKEISKLERELYPERFKNETN